MKNIIALSLLTASVFATKANAQDFYLKAGLGYAFPISGERMDQYGNALNGSVAHNGTSTTAYNIKNASFSSGMQGVIAAGLQISKNVGLELNTAINLLPHDYKETVTGQTNSNGVGYDYTGSRQAKSMVLLMPSVVLQTANPKWNLYTRMGLALPLNSDIKLHETYYYQTGDFNDYNWNIHNYFSLGFTAATGVKLNINEQVSLWGEMSLLYLNLSREERVLTTAVFNGQNYPVSKLTGVTTYNYHKNGIDDANGNQESLSQPFSNIGLNFGISYKLTGARKKTVGHSLR